MLDQKQLAACRSKKRVSRLGHAAHASASEIEHGRAALEFTAPILMMVRSEVGPTMRANVTMAVMLGFSLPDVIFRRERELFGDTDAMRPIHLC